MKVIVDFDACDNHGSCVDAAPEVFALNDDGTLVLLKEVIEKDLHRKVENASVACPTGAISIE